MIASRALRLVTFAVAGALGGAVAAATPALVVDVDTGKVLFAERATDPWFPASITKLMTTYVALDMVRSGRASMDQLLTLSEEAAAQPPSKMGFKPGTQLTLDNALKIIMVKSANDIAQTIAENLGGSVDGFAALMNETAQRVGMRESRWVNPHGLPDERQQTSARDMAMLGRALLRDFPEHKDLFQIGAIQFGRAIMRNHNGLIGRYPGADGMKTGFICAGGFNVVASATHDGRRLITVVLGSTTANERNLKAADLFDRGFVSPGSSGQGLDELPPSSFAAPPNMRPIVCDRRGPLPAEEDAPPAVASVDGSANAENTHAAALASSSLSFASVGSAIAPTRRVLGPRAPVQPIRVWLGATPPASVLAAASSPGLGAVPKSVALKPVALKAPGEKPAPKVLPDNAIAATPERKGAIKAAARVQPKLLQRGAGAVPPAAQAFTAMPTPSIIDDGKGTPKNAPKGAIRPSAAFSSASAPAEDDALPAAKPLGAAVPKPAAARLTVPNTQGAKAQGAKSQGAKAQTVKPLAAKLPDGAAASVKAASEAAAAAGPGKTAARTTPAAATDGATAKPAPTVTKPMVRSAATPAAKPKVKPKPKPASDADATSEP